MVYEDLAIALYLAILSGIVLSGAGTGTQITLTAAEGLGFCGAFVLIVRQGRSVIDRLLDQESSELVLFLIFAGVLFASLGAAAVGLSEAIGAFMFGFAVRETAHKDPAHAAFLRLPRASFLSY